MAGGSAGGSMAGGSAGGATVAPLMVSIPNSRFLGIAQVAVGGPPFGTVIATVREPLDGGSSILEGWASNGSPTPSQSRVISWSSAYRVTAIASNISDTALAVRSSNGISIEAVLPLSNFGTAGFINLESFIGASDAGVSRLSMLPTGSTAPVLAFVQGSGPNGSARLYRTGSGSIAPLSYTPSNMGGIAWGDDVIDSPEPGSSASRILVTARCSETCAFGGTNVTSTGLAARFAWVSYPPAATALGMTSMHALLVGSFSTPIFSPNGPVRVASDGNNFVYFGGQAMSGELVVERRAATTGMRDGNLLSSIGALQLVDVKRASNGAAVLLLATYQTSNVSFPTVLPFTSSTQRNVVVIRIDAMLNVSSTPFNLPGDQQAVGFAGGGNGYLHIAINEGPNAVLWRIPEP